MSAANEIRDALATPEQVQRAREYAASNSVTEIWQQRCRDGVYDDCLEVRSPLAAIIEGDAALAAATARADAWEADAARYASNAEYWKARADKAEALLETISDLLSDAVQSDCENGVKSLNERAAANYLKDAPDTLAAIRKTQEMIWAALEANDAGRAEVQHDAG